MKESKLLYPYRKNKINRAIFKLIGYTIFGSFIMLLGMILLYKEVGNMNYLYLLSISDSYDDPNSIIPKFIFISFFLAFSVKVPIMPFHI
jgi:NADH:ubiquinone oxidoreductase subunit 4 (subunit M)